MMILTGRTIGPPCEPPYPYGGEFVSQFLFALRLCWLPLLISTVAHQLRGAGPAGGELPDDHRRAGPTRRLLRAGRDPRNRPLITAIVLAGVAGTAITADLGARKIREELDALQVLGVDPIKNLVVPRFLALMIVTGLFDIYALLFGLFGGILAALVIRAAARSLLEHAVRQRHRHRPVGLGAEDDHLRRDHRDRVLLQGHDRLRRSRGRRARGQPGRRGGLPGRSARSTTPSRRRCWRRTRGHPGDQVSGLVGVSGLVRR